MLLSVIKSNKVIWEGWVSKVRVPGVLGTFTILPNHAPLISMLRKGEIHFSTRDSIKEESIKIEKGCLKVEEDRVEVYCYEE